MRLQRQSNRQIITLDVTSTLGHGGEARVYPVPQDETLVAKIYHKPTKAHADKLAAMLANPPENPTAGQGHISIAWPFDLLRAVEGNDSTVGFLMPRVKGMHSILDFYNPKSRRQKCPFFNYLYLHRTARNLAAAVGALHQRGYCVGDVNESNILAGNTALVTLVDTDSFQVKALNNVVYRCPVGKPEFTPPELQGKSFHTVERTIQHDLFGLAVVIFQLLMEGTHPFSGIFQGGGDPPPYEARIAAGHFSYSTKQRVPYTASPIAPPFEILHPSLRQLFISCFEDGHHNPLLRPNTQDWQNALREAEADLITCSTNSQHRYGKHLQACPWCQRTVCLGGRDPFPSWQAVKKGQHLQPIPPRRQTLPKSYKPAAPRTRTITASIPFSTTVPKKTKKKYGVFILGLMGIGVLGLLEVMLVVKDLKLGLDSATLLPTTNASALPRLTTNKEQGFTTHYNQGNADYNFGDYQEAIENFDRAIQANPNDAKAYVNRGNAYYESAQHSGDPDKDYKGAMENFSRALSINPNEVEAYVSRGMVRSEIAQYSKDSDGGYKQAIEDFNQALHRNPTYAKAYFQRGIVRYKLAQYNGDSDKGYKQALEDFNQALRLDPQEAEAYVRRGLLRNELEQYNENSSKENLAGIADLQKAAKIFLAQGDMDHYQQALGNICAELGDKCHIFLQNPDKFNLPGPDPTQGQQKQGN